MDYALGNIITQSELPSSRGLGHIPFTDATGVQIPLGVPFLRTIGSFFLRFFIFLCNLAILVLHSLKIYK